MTYIPEWLRQQVITRAHACCEYCLIPQESSLFTLEVDHIIAEKHRGPIIRPLTPVGRVTVFLLQMNEEIRLSDRTALIEAKRYPPLEHTVWRTV